MIAADSNSTHTLEAALEYAGRGWHVFPCFEPTPVPSGALICTCPGGASCTRAGKHPRTSNGVKDATTDPAQIRAWWQRWPHANVAIATGALSGIDVVDIDAKAGGVEAMEKKEEERGALPRTIVAQTSGEGYHVYFRHSGLVSKAASITPGIDTRGNGAYVIAPPSLHRTGERYAWVEGSTPAQASPADAPAWIRDAAQAKRTRSKPVDGTKAESAWQAPTRDGLTVAQLWKRWLHTSDPKHAAAVERMKEGQPLFPSGEHHENIWALLSYLRFKAPEASDETVLRLLAPSVVAMACTDHDAAHVAECLRRVNEQYGEAQAQWEKDAALFRSLGHSRPSTEATPTLDVDAWMTAPGYDTSDGQSLGIFKYTDKDKLSTVVAAPINITETGEDEHGTCYVTVRWMYGDRVRTETMQRAKVSGSEILELSGRGAPLTSSNSKKVQDFLQAQEQHNHARLPRVRIFTQSGWSQDMRSFVVGRQVIGEPGRVIMPGEAAFFDALVSRGSEDEHLRLTLAVRDRSPLAEMAWAAGFAAPLLRLLELRSMCLSIWGASGTGKSAVQATTTSLWGRPSGLKVSGDVSSAALQGELARHRDLPTWIDDTQVTREGMTNLMAYIVGTETSGARATQTGELRARKTWRSLAFISGEKPLLQIGGAAGAKNRTLEVCAQPLGDAALATQTHQGLERHHGHVGPAFIRALMEHYTASGRLDDLRELHRQVAARMVTETTEQARYAALLVLADRLARVHICGEDDARAQVAALDAGQAFCAAVLKESRETKTTADAAYDFIMNFVASNWMGFDSSNTIHRPGLVVDEKDASGRRFVAIFQTAMNDIAREGRFDIRQVMTELAAKDLVAKEDGHLTRKVSVDGKRVRAYWLVLDEEKVGAENSQGTPNARPSTARPEAHHARTGGMYR
ncbi:bifunctional DNA primase/polymerase [Myxococcus sp. AM011]|uniref:bifunctional DNA primase/polymerase n=1 Tax=Myxococcus sp. AM011 TaxID=2745200 RepID=UPI001594E76B|nr:bifunctional DNA primase/polymerase [Myxococcus sp. AM011]NVJ22096.1 bifunctional DNA primase/polymerase [Myxococcus sp. AM011]